MKDGGLFIVTVPKRPYRCPPGPYERATLVAHYLKQHKPKSKVVILDDDNTMPKQPLFLECWSKLYPGMIEWVTGNNGGKVERVDIKKHMVATSDADFPADVISFVPPQKAGAIAQKTGLTDNSGWCPVDPFTLESTRHKHIHIVGDAAYTDGVPKSAHIAGAMGRTAARAVVALLEGKSPPSPQYVNTCYTLAAPDYGFSIAGLYVPKNGVITTLPNSVTVSPTGASQYVRRTEAEFAYGWLRNIAAEAFL
jgi:NADPH-dependent 2,4-dienoyl-CoA reductase/sulfur reductase-like enzyme